MSVQRRTGDNGTAGFTLLEVVVAFAIMALSMAVLLSLFATGVRATRLSADYSEAVTLAESKLAEYGTVSPIETGMSSGRFDGHYRWQTVITVEGDGGTIAPELSVRLMRIEVQVSWDSMLGERTVSLATLRLARS